MKGTNGIRIATAVLGAIGTTGCYSPEYKVITPASPGAIDRGTCSVLLEPPRFDKVRIGDHHLTLDDYLSDKSATQRAEFREDEQASSAMYDKFVRAYAKNIDFAATPTDRTLTLRARVDEWEPGWYAGIAAHNGVAHMTVELAGQDGHAITAIVVERGGAGYTATQRMKNAFLLAGADVGSFLKEHVACARR